MSLLWQVMFHLPSELSGSTGQLRGFLISLQEGIDENAHTISAHYHSELGYPVKASIDYEEDLVDEELGFDINSLSIE